MYKKILFILFCMSFIINAFANTQIIPPYIKCDANEKNGDKRCYAGARIGVFTIENNTGSYPYYIIDGIYKLTYAQTQIGMTTTPETICPSLTIARYQNIKYPQINFEMMSDSGWYADMKSGKWGTASDTQTVCASSPDEMNCPLIYIQPYANSK